MKHLRSKSTDQLEIVDLDESDVELVAVVGHLLQPLQHRTARLVARVWETVSLAAPFPSTGSCVQVCLSDCFASVKR